MREGTVRFVETKEWQRFLADREDNDHVWPMLDEFEESDAEDLFEIIENDRPAAMRCAATIVLTTLLFMPELPVKTPWRTRLFDFLESTRRNEAFPQELRIVALHSLMLARQQEVQRSREGKAD